MKLLPTIFATTLASSNLVCQYCDGLWYKGEFINDDYTNSKPCFEGKFPILFENIILYQYRFSKKLETKFETTQGVSKGTTSTSYGVCSVAKVELVQGNEVVGYYIMRAKCF